MRTNRAPFNCRCNETYKPITKGEKCYCVDGKYYCADSNKYSENQKFKGIVTAQIIIIVGYLIASLLH